MLEHPDYIYYALLAFVVAPSMAINRMAILIAAVWTVGQFAYLIGLPYEFTDFGIDILAIGAGCAIMRRDAWSDMAVVGIFVPMTAANMAVASGHLHAFYGYWVVFGLAVAQVIVMPFGNDWPVIKEGIEAWRHPTWLNHLLRTRSDRA